MIDAKGCESMTTTKATEEKNVELPEEEDDEDLRFLASLKKEVKAMVKPTPPPKAPKTKAPKASPERVQRRNVAMRRTLDVVKDIFDSEEGKPRTDLTKCEELATELAGPGAAVSLEEKGGFIATVWDKKGGAWMVCAPRDTKTGAIALLLQVLKKEKRKAWKLVKAERESVSRKGEESGQLPVLDGSDDLKGEDLHF